MTQITIVGLGPGSPDLLTREALLVLERAREVFAQDERHPALASLPSNVKRRSAAEIGEATPGRSDVEARLADRVIELGRRPEGIIYAVPGNPSTDDESTTLVLERAAELGLTVRLVAGVSHVDAAAQALRLDGFGGDLQLVGPRELAASGRKKESGPGDDGSDPFAGVYRAVDPSRPVLVGPMRGQAMASLEPALLATYPADHRARLVQFGAASDGGRVVNMSVSQVPELLGEGIVAYLYLPPVERLEDVASFDTLLHVVARLRAPDGCPWDREQTYQSIKKHLIEETYEAVDALDHADYGRFSEELGDVLLQVAMYAQIGREAGDFDLEDVLRAVNAKLVRRHPHVFGDVQVGTAAEVLRNWEKIKRSEKGDAMVSSFAGLPEAAPALMRADAVQSRATRYGWIPPAAPSELVAPSPPGPDGAAHLRALGDALFALVATARREHVDPEEALRLATNRFVAAFDRVLADCQAEGVAFDSLPPEERATRLARASEEL